MEDMIQGLMAKVGIDRDKAEKVIAYLKENAAQVPQWLASNDTAKAIMDKLPGGLGDKLGGMLGGTKS